MNTEGFMEEEAIPKLMKLVRKECWTGRAQTTEHSLCSRDSYARCASESPGDGEKAQNHSPGL
jgi:hypothetical protein